MRLVLIAGPSSSGKTTFSKRLAVQLLANGVRPVAIEMDNYFVDRDHTPTDADGNYDFESGGARPAAVQQHLVDLMAGQEVQLPRFNFLTGKREPGEKSGSGPTRCCDRGHPRLEPRPRPRRASERIFRIYVSALTQLNSTATTGSTTDNRLIRRIVRDARTGATAQGIQSGGGRASTVGTVTTSSLTRRTRT